MEFFPWCTPSIIGVMEVKARLDQRLTALVHTTMLRSLPSETLDLIADHLHDDPAALKACCIASKPWVPRTRKHIFAHVEFHAQKAHIERWKKIFPDPSKSPARHTRSLSIHGLSAVTAAGTDAGGWIRTFHKVVHLRLESLDGRDQQAFLIPFHGLSPTVKSLHLTFYPSATFFEVFDLACSFPLLEDLAVISFGPESNNGRWNAPSTSPKLTGSLDLKTIGGTRSVIHRLLNLPHGLHFAKITVSCLSRDFELTTELVSRCSGTLESLTIYNWLLGAFSLASVIGQRLTIARRHGRVRDAFA